MTAHDFSISTAPTAETRSEVRQVCIWPGIEGQLNEGKLLDWATTPALRATPPVPGGEPAGISNQTTTW